MIVFRRWLVTAMLMVLLLPAGRAAAVELAVQSSPPGARIIIDGKTLSERTPAIISVSPGEHDLTLELEGRQPVTRRLQVSGRGFASFDLPPAAGSPTTVTFPVARPAANPPSSGPGNAAAETPPVRSALPPPASVAAEGWAAAPPYSAARRGDFGPTVTIRYRREPTHTARPGGHAELNLLPTSRPLETDTGPAPTPGPTASTPPSAAEENRPMFPLVETAAVHLAGDVQTAKPGAAASPTVAEELPDPADFAAEFLAALETELGEEALLLRETSDPTFIASDMVASDAVSAADAGAFAGATTGTEFRPSTSLSDLADDPTGEDEVEPEPGPPPDPPEWCAPFCAPEPETWWPSSAETRLSRAAAGLPSFPEQFNVLLLGLDRRDRRGILATGAEIPLERLRRIPARSDVIMVFQFDFAAMQVRVVSVPRDTRVRFGRGSGKVNAAFAFGREPLARKVIAGFLDIPIHRSVVVDWRAAKQCIALYKGLNLDYNGFTEKEMFWHLRKRSFARGDFQRIERQQKFLATAWAQFLAYLREAREAEGPAAQVTREMLDMAMQQAYSTVETDLTWDEVRLLNYAFRDYDPTAMVMTQVPGTGVLAGDSGSAAYYLSPVARHSFNDLVVRAEGNHQP